MELKSTQPGILYVNPWCYQVRDAFGPVLAGFTPAILNRIAGKFRADDLDRDQTAVRKSERLSVV